MQLIAYLGVEIKFDVPPCLSGPFFLGCKCAASSTLTDSQIEVPGTHATPLWAGHWFDLGAILLAAGALDPKMLFISKQPSNVLRKLTEAGVWLE